MASESALQLLVNLSSGLRTKTEIEPFSPSLWCLSNRLIQKVKWPNVFLTRHQFFWVNPILYKATYSRKLMKQSKTITIVHSYTDTYEWHSDNFLRKSATIGSIQWCLMTNVLERLMCMSCSGWKLATDWSCSHSSSNNSDDKSSLDVTAENTIIIQLLKSETAVQV